LTGQSALEKMNDSVREYLIDKARLGKTVAYQDLANACGLGLDMGLAHHRNEIASILGAIGAY
jgi:hypothetical protein